MEDQLVTLCSRYKPATVLNLFLVAAEARPACLENSDTVGKIVKSADGELRKLFRDLVMVERGIDYIVFHKDNKRAGKLAREIQAKAKRGDYYERDMGKILNYQCPRNLARDTRESLVVYKMLVKLGKKATPLFVFVCKDLDDVHGTLDHLQELAETIEMQAKVYDVTLVATPVIQPIWGPVLVSYVKTHRPDLVGAVENRDVNKFVKLV